MISLLKVAEEVNQLDTMFGKLAKQYSDYDHFSWTFGGSHPGSHVFTTLPDEFYGRLILNK